LHTHTLSLLTVGSIAALALTGPGAIAQPRRAPPQPVYSVRYRVQTAGGSRTLLGGEGARPASQPVHIAFRDGAEAPSLDLTLEAYPARDGTVLLRARWTESDSTGRRLAWDPQVRVARGHEGSASVALGPQDARILTLSVR
jgi:hypothetical protein